MEEKLQALAYLGQDRLCYADMLEPLRRGTAELLYAREDGVRLHERRGEVYMMSARTPEAARRCLELLPKCELLVGHEMWYKEQAAKRCGLLEEQICCQAVWTSPVPPPKPQADLRLLDPSWAPWVYQHYSHSFGGVEYIEAVIRDGMLGVFVDRKPAGFVGFHAEGSIGMLEVLPAYRRRGLGLALLHGAVRLAMERSAIPFGQIFADNAPSLRLQERAGMQMAQNKLFWLI